MIVFCDAGPAVCEYCSPSGFCKSSAVHVNQNLQCIIPLRTNGTLKPKTGIKAVDPHIESGKVIEEE